eukprot:TRINITY_DN7410_c0_g1_i2.p1 TRINITY_DN7410_c0_g1~~TRINITY_DN7410_c0_g1_i2.p1  ORF type:complete len:218 (+),score=15.97 TRINITY_DN7410_c0_g1_i2:57-710(+)
MDEELKVPIKNPFSGTSQQICVQCRQPKETSDCPLDICDSCKELRYANLKPSHEPKPLLQPKLCDKYVGKRVIQFSQTRDLAINNILCEGRVISAKTSGISSVVEILYLDKDTQKSNTKRVFLWNSTIAIGGYYAETKGGFMEMFKIYGSHPDLRHKEHLHVCRSFVTGNISWGPIKKQKKVELVYDFVSMHSWIYISCKESFRKYTKPSQQCKECT